VLLHPVCCFEIWINLYGDLTTRVSFVKWKNRKTDI